MSILRAIFAAVRASRYLQIGLALLFGLGGWHGWLAVRDARIASKVVATIEQKNTTLAAKGAEARKAAQRPGAADRLRQRYGEGF